MPSLNRVQLIGRLGRDPEGRTTATGKKLSRFSLAVDHRWKTSEGEARTETDWFNVEAWGRVGEIAQQYLHKGQLVYLEGRLKTDRYEQGGETRYFTHVVVSSLQMLQRRPDEEPPLPEETETILNPDEEEVPE